LKIILLLLLSFLLSSCADVSEGEKTVSPSFNSKVYTLSWAAPQNYEDNSLLTADNDLLEYRIYYGDSPGKILTNVKKIPSNKTSFSTSSLDASIVASYSKVHVGMTSVSKNGIESVLSKLVSFNP